MSHDGTTHGPLDPARDGSSTAHMDSPGASVGRASGHGVGQAVGQAAITLRDFGAGYDRSLVVRDADLTIAPGDFAAVIGPSGAGKTTLLKAIVGQVPHQHGTVEVFGYRVSPGRPPRGVGYVAQVEGIDWSFPMSVADVVMLGRVGRLGRRPWPSRADRRAVAVTLDRLGLGHLAGRHIRDLSGGQQNRTFLARALVGNPHLLLLDEPTANLDPRTRDDLLRALVDLNRTGVTVVMTTHEVNAVALRAPLVVCVNGGIVAAGRPAETLTEAVLMTTFDAPMRLITDPVTGERMVSGAIGHWDAAWHGDRGHQPAWHPDLRGDQAPKRDHVQPTSSAPSPYPVFDPPWRPADQSRQAIPR